jgi:hypothetical protein
VALAVTYFRTGSTTPCCEFPIAPDPALNDIEITDCSFRQSTFVPVPSHFNADASCPCNDNTAPSGPHVPTDPTPADGATNIDVSPLLSWVPSPLDTDIVAYYVHLGTDPTPPPIAIAIVTTPSYQPPAQLALQTTYYWRIMVRNAEGLDAMGPTWRFTTRAPNFAPSAPSPVSPPNGTSNVPYSINLQWAATDPENDPLTYDLYFGTAANPPLVTSGLTATSYPLSLAAATTYRWKVVAHDPFSHSTTGAIWSFTTLTNRPSQPANPGPANQAINTGTNVTLSWQATNPDGGALTYKVYLGTSPAPPLVASDLPDASYIANGLLPGGQYYWKIVPRNSVGAETDGSVWTFNTSQNTLPVIVSSIPVDAATNVPTSATLFWTGSDPNPQPLTYDLYFGVVTPPAEPPLVAQGLTRAFYVPQSLELNTTYYWRVIPHDPLGTGTGPLFAFTTGSTTTGASSLPLELALGRNHPNPFNPQTIIPYTVPSGASLHVRIAIFDATGRAVRVLVNETQSAGAREVIWRGENEAGAIVSSGIYYCVMDAGGKRFTQKLVLLK